jgi:hypothetical protein
MIWYDIISMILYLPMSGSKPDLLLRLSYLGRKSNKQNPQRWKGSHISLSKSNKHFTNITYVGESHSIWWDNNTNRLLDSYNPFLGYLVFVAQNRDGLRPWFVDSKKAISGWWPLLDGLHMAFFAAEDNNIEENLWTSAAADLIFVFPDIDQRKKWASSVYF